MVVGSPTFAAPAVFDTGTVQMGVANNGGLGALGVGLSLLGTGDAITPGCLCEGWGAAASSASGYVYGLVETGITSASLVTSTATDGVSTVLLANGLRVVHTYSSAAGGKLFRLDISIENTTAAAVTDVRYARTLDWDVPPGHFSDDRTTIFVPGSAPAGKVLHTSFDPFASPDPMVTRGDLFGSPPADTNGTDFPNDLGAYFILTFGGLGAGESTSFTTYIGADTTTDGLLAAFAAVGIEAYSYSYDVGPSEGRGPTFGWGFAGVGLPPIGTVPEPGSLALLGAALAGLAMMRRRRGN
jgi:hypothetical protein